MGELGRQPAFFADADGLGNAVEQAQALFAHVADIHAAVFAGNTGQVNDLFGAGKTARGIDQA